MFKFAFIYQVLLIIYMNIRLKKIIFPLLFLVPAGQVAAQQFYTQMEYGLQLGASGYFGDLNPNYGIHYVMPAGGAYVRYNFNPYISLRAVLNYTKVGADDAYSNNDYQKQRNLRFRSDIVEIALLSEFNFFRFDTGDPRHRFTPYLTGGIGTFYYNPYTHYNGIRYNLRTLGTEGQNTPEYADRKYNTLNVCIPIGAGIKYWIRPGVNFGFEIVNRVTFTDYMDDVSNTYIGSDRFGGNPMHPSPAAALQDPSLTVEGKKLGRAGKQRGDNATKDQYLMVQFSLSFQLKTYKCPSNRNNLWEP